MAWREQVCNPIALQLGIGQQTTHRQVQLVTAKIRQHANPPFYFLSTDTS
jgi:hypothetical protein